MSETGNETLDRIQQEIKENLEREEELRKKYNRLNNNNDIVEIIMMKEENNHVSPPQSPQPPITNGVSKTRTPTRPQNGARLFAQHPSKGVMQKFIKMRGKLTGVTAMKATPTKPVDWTQTRLMEPPRVSLEQSKDLRNGYVPAGEKMRRELVEFQKREAELRKERRRSQPDLMAALEAERENESNLKPVSALYSSGDLTDDSGAGSLKPARSLSDLLCDEVDSPGTHSLIRQFESLGNNA